MSDVVNNIYNVMAHSKLIDVMELQLGENWCVDFVLNYEDHIIKIRMANNLTHISPAIRKQYFKEFKKPTIVILTLDEHDQFLQFRRVKESKEEERKGE